jgi:hypothetical protein
MHLPVTSGDLISGDATSGDDPPHGPLQIRPGYILLSCHIYKRCELEPRSGEVYFIQHYVRFMVLNAIFNNISVISWRQFYWWRKPEYPEKSPPCRKSLVYKCDSSVVYIQVVFAGDRVGDRHRKLHHRKWGHRKWPEDASPEVVNRKRKLKGDITHHFFPVFPALFFHRVFAAFFSGTSLDSM